MQQRKSTAPRAAGEPRANAGSRTLDVNRERLVFCLTSLIGNRVTVKLRDSVTYEGLFHSCLLDNDYAITLKHARKLPSENLKSGEVIETLMIPGKDFLLVSAVDVPSPVCSDGDVGGAIVANTGFATDMDIAQRKAHTGGERELVAWAPAEGDLIDGALEDDPIGHHATQPWDQFSANKDMFGIASTWNEELYTTKLDTSTIPREKREEAERIAREIETGQCAAEVDGRIEGTTDADGEEENAFSAVARRKAIQPATGSQTELPAGVPLTRDALSQHDHLSGQDGFAREHRAKRGMITAHSPMRSPMISEMKRINALNLEPALPKLDDKTRNDWINFKQCASSQKRSATHSVQGGNGVKHEFQQSLDQMSNTSASAGYPGTPTMNKEKALEQIRKELAKAQTGCPTTGADSATAPGTLEVGRRAQQKPTLPLPAHGAAAADRKSFAFNPGAKEFTFNPSASSFTPQSSGAPASSAPAQVSSPQVAKTSSATTGPQFKPFEVSPELLKKSLEQVLDTFYENGTAGEKAWTVVPAWPDVGHVSFKEVLGQPNPNNPLPPVGAIAAGSAGFGAPAGGGGTMPGAWQGQAAGQMPPTTPVPGGPGTPTQMVPQGFMVAPSPANGGQQQMYPPMFPGPGGAVPVFNQQTIMGGQGSMMPAGMVAQQGGGTPGAMTPVPKFGSQVGPGMVMTPVGQFPQGFVPQQAMGQPGQQATQGQPAQPGGPAAPPAQ